MTFNTHYKAISPSKASLLSHEGIDRLARQADIQAACLGFDVCVTGEEVQT